MSGFNTRLSCPACASDHISTIYSCSYNQSPVLDYIEVHFNKEGKVDGDLLKDADYILCNCDSCGCVFQRNVPDSNLLGDIYNIWLTPDQVTETFGDADLKDWMLAAWGGEFDQLHLHPKYSRDAHEIFMVSHMLNVSLSELQVLDYGSGWGTWVRVAKAMGCDTYGFELSEKAATFTKRFDVKMIGWDEIHKFKFDFINTEQVFEHIDDPLKTLQYLKSSLKPGGIIKISVPTGRNISEKLSRLDIDSVKNDRESMFPVEPLVHINCFSKKSIESMAAMVGLSVLNVPIIKAYSFLLHNGLNLSSPKQIAKSLLRPIYRLINPRNLYIFLRNDD